MPPSQQPTMLDSVADDLAGWIDRTADEVANAFAPGRAPFAAPVTEEQKLEYYRNQLFFPDGSPNPAGRQAQLTRLGTLGFTRVYKAVVRAYPALAVPTPPELTVPQQSPSSGTLAPAVPAAPGPPPGAPPSPPPGSPPGAVGPPPGPPRPMPVPPRPPILPPRR